MTTTSALNFSTTPPISFCVPQKIVEDRGPARLLWDKFVLSEPQSQCGSTRQNDDVYSQIFSHIFHPTLISCHTASRMKLQSRAIIVLSLFFLIAEVHARLGEKRVGGRDYLRGSDNDADLDVVVVFEDDDADAFTEMSSTFTSLGEDVEVHSMLTKLKMATVRAKPKVSIPSSEANSNTVDCLILIVLDLSLCRNLRPLVHCWPTLVSNIWTQTSFLRKTQSWKVFLLAFPWPLDVQPYPNL